MHKGEWTEDNLHIHQMSYPVNFSLFDLTDLADFVAWHSGVGDMYSA
jgi:hypothetical protein